MCPPRPPATKDTRRLGGAQSGSLATTHPASPVSRKAKASWPFYSPPKGAAYAASYRFSTNHKGRFGGWRRKAGDMQLIAANSHVDRPRPSPFEGFQKSGKTGPSWPFYDPPKGGASWLFHEPAKPGRREGGPSGIFTTRQGAAHSRFRGDGLRRKSCGHSGPGLTCPCLARENTPRVHLSGDFAPICGEAGRQEPLRLSITRRSRRFRKAKRRKPLGHSINRRRRGGLQGGGKMGISGVPNQSGSWRTWT